MQNPKAELRRQVRETAAAFEKEYVEKANAAIFENIISLPEYKSSKTVFVYYSMGIEPDTVKVIGRMLEDGKTVAVPLSLDGGIMEAREIKSLTELVPGKYGIPTAPADAPLILPENIDFVLVPAVAFDRQGYRLGRGGGYYDRFLGKSPSFSAGLAFDKAVLERVIVEEYDMPVNCLVTEKGAARF